MPVPPMQRMRSSVIARWVGTLVNDQRSRGVIVLTMGGTAASVVGLALLPLITNAYQPSTYATFALVFTAASVLGTVATGKFEQAIPLQEADDSGGHRSQRLGALSLAVASLLCLAGQGVLLVMVAGAVLPVGDGGALLWSPLLIWLSSLSIIQTQLLTRDGRYAAIAAYQLLRTVLQLATQIWLGLVDPSVGSLLLGFAISLVPQAIHTFWLLRGSLWTPIGDLRRLVTEERHLPIYQAPTALVRALETNIALFVLAATYGDTLVALYALALRVVVSPATLVASAANTVYLKEAPQLGAKDHHRLYRRLSWALGALGLLSIAILVLLADPISAILGSGWEQVGAAIRATAPLALAVFLGAIPSTTLLVVGRSRLLFGSRTLIAVLPNVVVVAAFYAGVPGIDALLVYSAVLLACVVALTVVVMRHFSSSPDGASPSTDCDDRATISISDGVVDRRDPDVRYAVKETVDGS